jgi:hypothetical protein
MKGVAMFLRLRRTVRNAETFCALEKTGKPTTPEERRRVQLSGWRSEFWCIDLKTGINLCVSYKRKLVNGIVRIPTDYLTLIHSASASFHFYSLPCK